MECDKPFIINKMIKLKIPFTLDDLESVARRAARLVLSEYVNGFTVHAKEDQSPVTSADLKCNEFLKTELIALMPQASWLSEESVDDSSRNDSEWVWIVDPLDGTKEYVRRVPEFAISMGLCHQGVPVAGAVINPPADQGGISLLGETRFWGFQSRNTPCLEIKNAKGSVSRSEVEKGLVRLPDSRMQGLVPVGSAAYKLLRVAAREDDFSFSLDPKNEWDICGGVALLNAAGLEYARMDGVPVIFNQSPPRIESASVSGHPSLVKQFLSLSLFDPT